MPVFDVEAIANEWKTKFGIPDTDIATMVKEVKAGFMRQDDYSRNSQTLQQDQARLAAERQQVQATYAELQEYERWVKGLEAQYGPRDSWNAAFQAQVQNQNPNAGLDVNALKQHMQQEWDRREQKLREEFSGQLELTGQGAAAFSKFYYTANKHWEKEYGSELPEADFQKFYTENAHNNPTVALALFEAPYKEKKQADELERKLEQARREGAQSALSQAGIPGDLGSSAGGWFGAVSLGNAIAVGANDTAAGNGETGLTRDQQIAKFNANMEARASKGEFKTGTS